ncbi:MAG: hypothetical protein PHW69_05610 [Elusimicrobiaceae bacterium]|nr:hypothetical protein [Elusimicrobiaceae bacterium]
MKRAHAHIAGFTLIEIQIAVFVLLLAVAGMGAVVTNNLKQLTWLEARTQHTVFVPADNTSAIFAVISSTPMADKSRNHVDVTEVAEAPPDFTATVLLTDR